VGEEVEAGVDLLPQEEDIQRPVAVEVHAGILRDLPEISSILQHELAASLLEREEMRADLHLVRRTRVDLHLLELKTPVDLLLLLVGEMRADLHLVLKIRVDLLHLVLKTQVDLLLLALKPTVDLLLVETDRKKTEMRFY